MGEIDGRKTQKTGSRTYNIIILVLIMAVHYFKYYFFLILTNINFLNNFIRVVINGDQFVYTTVYRLVSVIGVL